MNISTEISLRDHFAGLAMQAIISRQYHNNDVSELAYTHADAMLKERDDYKERHETFGEEA